MGKNRPVGITLCYNQLTHSILTFNFIGETSGSKMLPHSWCQDFQSHYFQKEMNIHLTWWRLNPTREFCRPTWVLSDWALKEPEFSLPGSCLGALWPWLVQGWPRVQTGEEWSFMWHLTKEAAQGGQKYISERKKISVRHLYTKGRC